MHHTACPRMHQTFLPPRTEMTHRTHKHRADHGIPGAETPPGSHLPRGKGQGHGGFWLHLLFVPAALPASVLKSSHSERGLEGEVALASRWNIPPASAAWGDVGSGGPHASLVPVAGRQRCWMPAVRCQLQHC